MTYTAPPVRYDHDLIIGDSYQPAEVQLLDAAGDPVSLVGATGTSALVSESTGSTLASPTVTVTDAANGRFTWSLAAATTAGLSVGYAAFYVRLTFGDTTVRVPINGRVTIKTAWGL